MTSFSGLTQGSAHAMEHRVEQPDHDQAMDSSGWETVQSDALSPFTFPRGAQAGLFLHYLFENISFPEARGKALAGVATRAMGHYGIDEQWLAVVTEWVANILDTPLDEKGALRLRDIPDHKRLVELEFQFPVTGLDARAINALLAQSRGEGRQPATLDFASIKGMMKGFIDLIFEHEGRFYVLDYKSNHLGHRYEDYQPASLNQAIDGHYYDLQYLIYTLALHRYLETRLPDYDYERHIGGVYYLFLRGMHPQQGNRTGVYADRPSRQLIESLEHCFAMKEREVKCA
jgi:exodeoxyribonuclease V beta subunit